MGHDLCLLGEQGEVLWCEVAVLVLPLAGEHLARAENTNGQRGKTRVLYGAAKKSLEFLTSMAVRQCLRPPNPN
jgi:hypothetical protein